MNTSTRSNPLNEGAVAAIDAFMHREATIPDLVVAGDPAQPPSVQPEYAVVVVRDDGRVAIEYKRGADPLPCIEGVRFLGAEPLPIGCVAATQTVMHAWKHHWDGLVQTVHERAAARFRRWGERRVQFGVRVEGAGLWAFCGALDVVPRAQLVATAWLGREQAASRAIRATDFEP